MTDSSLIICSRNRPRLLLETVSSVLAGDEVPDEIVIVDQSSTPHPMLDALHSPRCRIRYIHSRSVGLTRATNEGIAAAMGDTLVFTHDDVLVEPSWFGTLLRTLAEHGPRTVVTGQVRGSDAECTDCFVPWTVTSTTPATYRGRLHTDVLLPLNMAMDRGVVEAVGAFDERLGPGTRFPAAEDNDYGYRILEHGFAIYYTPDAVLVHRAWRPLREYARLRWDYGRGQGAYYAKYLSLRDRHMLRRMTRNVVNRAYQAAWKFRRRRRESVGDAAYVLAMLSGAAEWTLRYRMLGRGD